MDLALNNLQRLICHKTQQTNQILIFCAILSGSLFPLNSYNYYHYKDHKLRLKTKAIIKHLKRNLLTIDSEIYLLNIVRQMSVLFI